MIVYYSMIIWIGINGFISRYLPKRVVNNNFEKIKKPCYFIVFATICYIFVLIGLRSGVGDTYAYIQIFNNLPDKLNLSVIQSFDKDVGFFIFSVLFKQFISSNYHIWLFVISWISGLLITKTLYKYSDNFFYSMFLFIVMLDFVWMLNGMRQFIAVSLIFGNIDLFLDKKFIKCMLLIALASTIHISALFTIPIYFLVNFNCFTWKFYFFIIILFVVGINIDYIANTFSIVLEDTAYEGYLTEAATSTGSNLLRVAVGAAPCILAFIGRKQIQGNKLINFCINMSIISAIFYFISSFSGGILIGRIPIYFDVFNLILIPWLIKNIFVESNHFIMYLIVGICYFAFFYLKAKYGMGLGYESDILRIFV
ncbi:EpsG family protein [Thomasclavelia sp.]|uniref:EpsG family protein n=1 Tax=Thomasclavelia sp. TaxID=3025757 RepID=UPI0025E5A4C8|nr:EpsG family protein [Thomasclavelia sp.]